MLSSERELLAEIARLRAEGWENCPRCELMKRSPRMVCRFCELELLGISVHAPIAIRSAADLAADRRAHVMTRYARRMGALGRRNGREVRGL